MKLLTIGNIAFDKIMKVKFLPKINEATSILRIKNDFGGCAGNVAVVARNLGVDAAIYACVGYDFFKSDYERRLKDLDIDMENLQHADDLTARSYLFSDENGNQQIYYYSGASSKLSYMKVDFSKYSHVHFSAGEMSIYEKLMRDAREAGCIISFDPGQEVFHRNFEEIERCLPYPDYIFFNEHEKNHVMEELKLKKIEEIFSENTKAIIVSKGGKGSTLYMKDKSFEIPAVKCEKLEDTTGAGDSHRAGFIVGIMRGYDEIVACRIGSIVSYFVIQGVGAQENIPSWEDVMGVYKDRFGHL